MMQVKDYVDTKVVVQYQMIGSLENSLQTHTIGTLLTPTDEASQSAIESSTDLRTWLPTINFSASTFR